MSVRISGTYEGQKRVRLIHEQSTAELVTDAPLDNHGKGESFSPTDLLAASLGSCMLTVMGIFAERQEIDIAGATVSVVKEMSAAPRRVARVSVDIQLPAAIADEDRTKLEKIALSCPVHRSLHPDIDVPVEFTYK